MTKLIVLAIFISLALIPDGFAISAWVPLAPEYDYYRQKIKEELEEEIKREAAEKSRDAYEESYDSDNPDPEFDYYGDLDNDRPEVISFGSDPEPTEVIICSYKNRVYDCKPIK